MTNFKIEFTYPLILLLIVVAVFLTLLSFFRSGKRYRNNRNRIVSVILHITVMVLCISVLAGINISYDLPNTENEILIVVDLSDSGKEASERRDLFIRSVIDEGGDNFRFGVVTFGYNQVYAVPTTNNSSTVYQRYKNATLPDLSASDISSALLFAREKIQNPQTAKILLVSDGIQTDTNALNVIKSVTSEGITVDTACFSSKPYADVQIVGVKKPEHNVIAGETFTLELSLNSSINANCKVVLQDSHANGNKSKTYSVSLTEETKTVQLEYSFDLPGFHSLSFSVQSEGDRVEENNVYCTYMDLLIFDKILLVENYEGESDKLMELLILDYDVTQVNVNDQNFPNSLEELREYDQVVMVNVANGDMPEGFIYVLKDYVEVLGGGLLTVGGNKYDANGNVVKDNYGDVVSNIYNHSDMLGSVYQEMLPVKVEDYSPPVGVMLIIDRSGSMGGNLGDKSKLELAKMGALSCINVLTSRDYVGVITLEEFYNEEAQLTPIPQRGEIEETIKEIDFGGGTVFKGALEKAGAALTALSKVERRHIILITDGAPSDGFSGINGYGSEIVRLNQMGITLSVVTVGANSDDAELMRVCAEELGGGRFYNVLDHEKFTDTMRDELLVKEIKSYNPEEFLPKVTTQNSILNGIEQDKIPLLGGFYGSVKKQGATEILSSEYVPIYATWKYGKGTVSSFMCDLSGEWSNNWFNDSTGKQLIRNIINSNFPTNDLSAQEISVRLKENNYQNQMDIFTQLNDGESIEVTLTSVTDKGQEPIIIKPTAESGYSRLNFEIRQFGVYKIQVQKLDSSGQKIGKPYVFYKNFSHSDEYDSFADYKNGEVLLERIAELGGGRVINESWEIFERVNIYVHKNYDPKPLFVIIALVLFLLDIAVRKFKFRWPHEIIRDKKIKNQLK